MRSYTVQSSTMQCSFCIHRIKVSSYINYQRQLLILHKGAFYYVYLRHPSKNSAVLLLVFLILGLIMTWVQGKAQGMRKFQMFYGRRMQHNVAKCTDKKIKRTAILCFDVLLGCIADVLLRILENNNL